MDSLDLTLHLLRVHLQLGARADALTRDSPLMGSLPEINSLTVTGIIAAIEEQTGVAIGDHEIVAELFETVGTLADFIERKCL